MERENTSATIATETKPFTVTKHGSAVLVSRVQVIVGKLRATTLRSRDRKSTQHVAIGDGVTA